MELFVSSLVKVKYIYIYIYTTDIHRRVKWQYRKMCMSLQEIYEWHRKFKCRVVSWLGAHHSGSAAVLKSLLRANTKITHPRSEWMLVILFYEVCRLKGMVFYDV